MNNYVSWDVEIAGGLEHPAGITCAATLTSTGDLTVWHGPELADGMCTEVMLPSDLLRMLKYLLMVEGKGYPILTWNGVGFDFRVLASFLVDPARKKECAALALRGIDPGFHFFCSRGFMPGLAKVCEAFGIQGKLEGMDGAKAISKWREDRAGQELTLEYVAQDVKATADVYNAIVETGYVPWITRTGRNRSWLPINGQIIKSGEALALPVPNNSWMDDPWTRDKFIGWIKELGML